MRLHSKTILLAAALLLPCQSFAWIAYGFKSGMSRFDVSELLAERDSLVITEAARQTEVRGSTDDRQYSLVYCATPQRLYLMRYRLPDDPESFVQTLQKLESRYGEPEGLGDSFAYTHSKDQQDAKLTAIWNLNEYEPVLLIRDQNGMQVEFQDVSVC